MAKTKKKIFKGKASSHKTTVSLQIETNKWHIGINKIFVARLRKIGDMMKQFFGSALTGPRTGREYWIPQLQKWYTASAPHEYPAEKFGLLKKSINYRTGVNNKGPFLAIGVTGEAVRYAKLLETPGSGVYRPFLRRGMLENESKIKALLKNPYRL